MKVIINADDFGRNHEVNLAIVEAFGKGYITNATIMTNMPGYEEAVFLAKKHGFFDKVGLHLNFFSGKPLTEKIKKIPMFMDGDEMTSYPILHKAGNLRKLILPKKTRIALREEAEAQIEKYLKSGFTQMHLDSHGHSHTIPSVYFSIRKSLLLAKFNTVRLSLNLFSKRNLYTKIYKIIINCFIKKDFKTADYFTSASEYAEVINNKNLDDAKICEIMVHPSYDQGELVNSKNVGFEELIVKCNKQKMISFNEV